jgi:hypothetical protein
LLRERRSVLTLLDADYTYLNERPQRTTASKASKTVLAARRAAGRQPEARATRQTLTATSAPNRTSPVVRGAWVIENILGAAVPTPPPGVEADLAKEASEAEGLSGDTVRARLEMHRTNPTCAACHAIMDPLGLALENFDLVGRWRERRTVIRRRETQMRTARSRRRRRPAPRLLSARTLRDCAHRAPDDLRAGS